MAEYKFTVDNFSLKTSWKRMVQASVGIVGYDIVAGTTTKNFFINGITLSEGESIKYIALTANLSKTGTEFDGISIQVNDTNFGGSRKFKADGVGNDTTWEAKFLVKASGNTGSAGALNQAVSHNCTVSFSDVTLTVVTGVGNIFDGKVSSLNEGDKILIKESVDSSALYTLVHHEYNVGKALIFRDASYGTSRYRSSASYSGYNNSSLDRYLTDTFYPALPSTTTQFLQTLDYPIAETTYNNTAGIIINRTAATISAVESGLGSGSHYGSFLNYTDTIGIGEAYWTRQPVGGMDEYACLITADNKLASQSIKNQYGVRPTLGVLENQLVRYSETDGGYIFCTQCIAPETVYIDGVASDIVGLNSEANMILSWSEGVAGYNVDITGYAVWYSTSVDGTYELYGTTTGTSMTIVAPKKGYKTYYFKVQTLAPEDVDYCNSELSSDCRSVATKRSNVYYYDGYSWKIAMPKQYDGNIWRESEGAKYYNGARWLSPE